MTRYSALLLAFLLASLAWADDKKDVPPADKKPELKLTDDEKALVELTNAERKKADKDLKPLKVSPQLMEAARKHALNMAAEDKLAHELDGKGPVDRAQAAGYKSKFVGENIAWNQKTPEEAMKAWMGSEMHRENILEPLYTEIGVAVAKNKNGEPYWVQVFGKP